MKPRCCAAMGYVDLIAPQYPEKEVFTTPMTQELERCRWALESAGAAGPPLWCAVETRGVYGMRPSGAGPGLPGGRGGSGAGDHRGAPAPRCWVRRWGTTSA
ncbi:MAG: hypothetical protein ACLTYN_03845 [Dysosmobacter welbionis]